MSADSSTNPHPDAVRQTREQIRGLVDEITDLARKNLAAKDFFAEFLRRVVEALAAVGGAVWVVDDEGQFQLTYQMNLKASSLDEEGEHQARHAQLLSQVIASGEAMLVPPHSGTGDPLEGANPTEMLLVLAPVPSEQRTDTVVEIFQRSTVQPVTRRSYLHFLTQMCELAGQWHKSHELRQLGTRASLWRQVDRFAESVHESLDLKLTAYTIANETQRLVGCDRVSVAIRRRQRCIIKAVSGQDTFDKRSNVVTLLERLVTKVVQCGEPVWYPQNAKSLSPQIEEAIEAYVDESHAKTVAVLPLPNISADRLRANPSDPAAGTEAEKQLEEETLGALVLEQIEDLRSQEELAPRVDLIHGHAARALTNSLAYHGLFLMPLWRWLGKSRRLVQGKTLPKTLAVTVAVVFTIGFLFLYPARFDLKGRGVVQPVVRRDVFVDTEGLVTRVHVRHGERVRQGDLLVELRNTELEVRLADVAGQRQTTREQLTSLRRMRLDRKLPRDERNRLAGELLQLAQRLESLEQQQRLLLEKKEQLKIRSPIAGQVVTWNVRRDLLSRPVAAGQILMTVADPSGDWELEVFMPENRMGHITDARADLGDELEVDYVVATDPTTRCRGTVRAIHMAAQLHEEHGHAVQILTDIDKNDFRDPRPGATATAKIHCGFRPIGYVWLHELIEFFHSRVLFYF